MTTDYRKLEERLRAKPTFENAREAADAIKALREENERLREVLCNVQHGHVCPAQPGWLDAGPCTCGLDAALSPTASKEGGG
jgi:D-Tyr-tRNAtyr deacylase